MRSPLAGLGCVLIAAGCSTHQPAKDVDSSYVATGDTTVSSAPQATEPTLVAPEPLPNDTVDQQGDAAATRRATATPAPDTIGSEPPETARRSDTARNEATATPGNAKPDNTKVNERDTSRAAPTPIDQGENTTDLKITQQIRQAVMGDGTLSFTAKNVKIITQSRKVTLRGPVKTAAERSSIDALARGIAGQGMVDNQLEVVP